MRRLQVEFSGGLEFTYIMVGIAQTVDPRAKLEVTLQTVAESGMPADPRVWLEAPPRSSFPACLAVKAAAEQGLDGPYLRRLRLGLMTRRERIDDMASLTAAARDVDGLDLARFEIDLRSNAIVEAFGADRERAAAESPPSEDRPGVPAFSFDGGPVLETGDLGELRAAALGAGAQPGPLPDPEAALRQLGPMGAAEVAAVCDLPGPRARMELWRLAGEFRARPTALVCGELWEAA